MDSYFYRLIEATDTIRSRPWLAHLAAILLSLGAIAMRLLIGDVLTGFPFLTLFPAVMLATFLGGLWPGVTASVLCGLWSDYYLIPPYHSIVPVWPAGWIALFFYAATVATIVALTNGMLVALQRAHRSEVDLQGLNLALEVKVAERTAALKAEIAERAQAEATIRQMQKMEAIGQLTGGVAHDFNNMLGIVIGSLDMARRRLKGSEHPQLPVYLDHATEGARRAATLTARLLAFSRQTPLEPHPVEINKLVAGMSDLLRRTIGENIQIETVLAGGLWRTFIDAAQLENALINLAINARDAMPGGGKLTVETANTFLDERYAETQTEVTPGQYVMVSVTDTGSGMTPDVMERAFDPFYTTKQVGKGTGLGLSQVFGYVKQSLGHVKIYSELGQGTTVKIYMPRHTGAVAAPDAVESKVAAQGSNDTLVLVVEDDDQVRQTTVAAVRELGYSVLEAETASHALSLVATRPVDILFTDVVMPEMSGRELADRARREKADLAVLFTTGYTRNAIVHNGVLDEGVALLSKPFTLSQLAAKLRDARGAPVAG
jgi:signal transduction histidine kinase/ActR/RegA family two-component response regulator